MNQLTESPTMVTQPTVANMAAMMQSYGLQESDMADVEQIVARIQPDQESIAAFGRDVADHTSSYADDLLSQVRNADLQEIGGKLTEIVGIARKLNAQGLSEGKSKIPLLGHFLNRVRLRSQQVMGRFETSSNQINSLIEEVDRVQGNIVTRNAALNDMYDAVKAEHRLLGLHIAAGKIQLEKMRTRAAQDKLLVGEDPARVQALMDYEALITNLDKRIGDLQVLQHAALQSLPTIRMIQANNQLLIDKFHTIQDVTVPAWKREFMLALTLNEQKNAVQLATAIDDTTNDLMRRNAELLHQNSVQAARANQRLVIDVETLKKVNSNLIKTVEDVMKIQHDGMQKRQQAEQQIQNMRREIQQRITR